jgi:hypothetical protein
MPKQTKETIKEEVREEKPASPKKNTEFYWIFGGMIVLIAVFLISYSIFQGLNKFEYEGLTFTKEKTGEIPFFKYYFYAKNSMTGMATQEPRLVNVYFRVDPRQNNVPVEGEIEFGGRKDVYVSVNPENLTKCEYGSVGISTLSMFLASSYIPVKGATPIKELAKETNITYATCDNHPKNYVILIQSANETKVTKQGNNCYVIDINGCDEIMPAIEKFILQSILDAKARQSAENSDNSGFTDLSNGPLI